MGFLIIIIVLIFIFILIADYDSDSAYDGERKKYFEEIDAKANLARNSEMFKALAPAVIPHMEAIRSTYEQIVVAENKVYYGYSPAGDEPGSSQDIFIFHDNGYQNLSLMEQEALAKCISELIPGFYVKMYMTGLLGSGNKDAYIKDPIHYRPFEGMRSMHSEKRYNHYSFCYVTITDERMRQLQEQEILEKKAAEEKAQTEEKETYKKAF